MPDQNHSNYSAVRIGGRGYQIQAPRVAYTDFISQDLAYQTIHGLKNSNCRNAKPLEGRFEFIAGL